MRNLCFKEECQGLLVLTLRTPGDHSCEAGMGLSWPQLLSSPTDILILWPFLGSSTPRTLWTPDQSIALQSLVIPCLHPMEYNTCPRTPNRQDRFSVHWPFHAQCSEAVLISIVKDSDFCPAEDCWLSGISAKKGCVNECSLLRECTQAGLQGRLPDLGPVHNLEIAGEHGFTLRLSS